MKFVTTQFIETNDPHYENINRHIEETMTKLVCQGKPKELLDFILALPQLNPHTGKLAESELRSAKNTFISACAITRHITITAGLNPSIANVLCDQYICKIESLYNHDEIMLLLTQMMLDYARRMQKLIYINISNPLIIAILNDVMAHLYEPLSVCNIAQRLGYSSEHLCRQFKIGMGITITEYIQKQKIEESQYLLYHTDYSLLEISESLCFSSQSYFQRVFHKICETTPMQFRMRRIR